MKATAAAAASAMATPPLSQGRSERTQSGHPDRGDHDRDGEQEGRSAQVEERVFLQGREGEHLRPERGDRDRRGGPAQPEDGDQPGYEQRDSQPHRPKAEIGMNGVDMRDHECAARPQPVSSRQVVIRPVSGEPRYDRAGIEAFVDAEHEHRRAEAGHDRFGQAAPGAARQLDGTHGSKRRDAHECDGMAQQHAAPDSDRQSSSAASATTRVRAARSA